MRRTLSALMGPIVVALLALALAGCEGPEGPPGPTGPVGATGPAGPVGPAGQDVNENCTQCHTSDTDLFARQIQYQNSKHFTGGNFERNSTTCAACHTHEGFLDRIATGEQTASVAPENPSPPNCRTCHQIHTTYTDADFNLTTEASFALWIDGETIDIGYGNLCAQCHQGRPIDPAQAPVIDGPDITFTSQYWGNHYGTQANTLAGTGGFEFAGTATISGGPSSHGSSSGDGCVTCHMAEPYGAEAGGHTWKMTYEYRGSEADLTAGCETCHSTVTDFGYAGVQDMIQTKLDSLGVLLRAIGIVNAASDYPIPGTWSANVAAATLNWRMILEDRSLGVHNPPYANGLLQNSIEMMDPLVP